MGKGRRPKSGSKKCKVGPVFIVSIVLNVIFVQIVILYAFYNKSALPSEQPAAPMLAAKPKRKWRKDYSQPKSGILGKLLHPAEETPRPTLPKMPTPMPHPTPAPVKHLAPQYLPKFLLAQRAEHEKDEGGDKHLKNRLREKVSRRLLTPSYNATAIELMRKLVEALDEEHHYVPCLEADCDTSLDRIWAFNPWKRPLYMCGVKILPSTAVEIVERCHEGARVFSQEPTLRGIEKIDPIDFMFHKNDKKSIHHPTLYEECPVPCRQYGAPSSISMMYIDGEDWEFRHTMESAHNYPEMGIQADKWKDNVYFSTTSFKSDIPLPYFSWAEYDIQTPAAEYDNVIKGASYIASNCEAVNNRDEVVQELMKSIRVDSLGSCIHNAEPPENHDEKKDMQAHYLFHLAFENTNEIDYITEKMWGTLHSGSLPVYMGAPNIKEHAPENSIISWHDFKSTKELGEYLQKVAANKTLYDSYHAWRTQPLPQHFHDKYDMTHSHSACRTCKWVYAKQRGLGWNHDKQDMTQLQRSRRVCLDSDKFIVEPFVETVMTNHNKDARHEKPDGKPHCHVANTPRLEEVGGWERTVWYHDGVTDIVLEGKSNDIYRISTGMSVRAKMVRPNVYYMQDDVTRITFVVDRTVLVSCVTPPEGVIDFRLSHQSSEPKRIRIITEDVDKFHEAAAEAPNHYGELMVSEFEHPLQFFKIIPKKKSLWG